MRGEAAKESARQRARIWHWANRERANATSRRWYAANADIARERTLKWRQDNPERARLNDAKKRANRSPEYLERRRIDEQNRRARIRASGGKLSKGLGAYLLLKQSGLCACCRADITARYDMDHIMPLAKGGKHANDNIQLLCPTCNRRKHTKLPSEFSA